MFKDFKDFIYSEVYEDVGWALRLQRTDRGPSPLAYSSMAACVKCVQANISPYDEPKNTSEPSLFILPKITATSGWT